MSSSSWLSPLDLLPYFETWQALSWLAKLHTPWGHWLWFVGSIKKLMNITWRNLLLSSFLLVTFLNLFLTNLLNRHFYFLSVETILMRLIDILPKASPRVSSWTWSWISLKSVITSPWKPVSICSQNAWFILSYNCCSSWWLFMISPKLMMSKA